MTKKYSVFKIHKNQTGYPVLLKQIPDAPKKLFYRGVLKDVPLISIVGSRKASVYGKRVIEKIVPKLIKYGIGVVSGLAYGIDAHAHRVTVECGGYAVAVLAGGLDKIYPMANQKLAEDLLDCGGALVSEHELGMHSQKFMFPARNRIIAAMSQVTLVVEAAEKSGSLITAFQALEYNRLVGAVPGSIFSDVSVGCNDLIGRGGFPIRSAKDILELFNVDFSDGVCRGEKFLQKNIPKKYCAIYSLLSQEPMQIDELIKLVDLPESEIMRNIMEMEIEEFVKDVGGKRYIKNE